MDLTPSTILQNTISCEYVRATHVPPYIYTHVHEIIALRVAIAPATKNMHMNKTISKSTIVITPNLPVYRVRVKRDGAHSIALMIGLISKELWSSLNRVLNECESGSSYLASTSGGG